MVVILGTVAMPALSASAFRPPAFCVGRVTAARAKTNVVAYVDNADSMDKQISELKAENLNLQFKMISDKIVRVDCKFDILDRKIDDVKKDLDRKIDRVDCKIDDVANDLKTVSKDLSTLKTGLVVITCLCVAPQLPTILAFFK
jgi:predicted RNase H-like nuclease (RuvC/YqgF family)